MSTTHPAPAINKINADSRIDFTVGHYRTQQVISGFEVTDTRTGMVVGHRVGEGAACDLVRSLHGQPPFYGPLGRCADCGEARRGPRCCRTDPAERNFG